MGTYCGNVRCIYIRIGEEATIYLLKNACIFLPSKNGCLYQICGQSIDGYVGRTIIPLPIEEKVQSIGLKRCASKELNAATKRRKSGIIPWSHILYGKPVYSDDGKIVVSLPPKHILSTCSPQDLVITIFEQNPKRIHWRVKKIFPLVKKLIKNHKTCNYQALLNYYCPETCGKQITDDTDILQLDSSALRVEGFIKAVIRRVIPLEMLGTKANLNQFLKS
jgi:hypothetical protein